MKRDIKRHIAARAKPIRPKRKAKRAIKRYTRNRQAKRASVGAKKTDAVERIVLANAQTLGLPLDPAWLKGIVFNLRLVLRHAALLEEFPIDEDTEPAPVFHA